MVLDGGVWERQDIMNKIQRAFSATKTALACLKQILRLKW